jgi:hypothetical protein
MAAAAARIRPRIFLTLRMGAIQWDFASPQFVTELDRDSIRVPSICGVERPDDSPA